MTAEIQDLERRISDWESWQDEDPYPLFESAQKLLHRKHPLTQNLTAILHTVTPTKPLWESANKLNLKVKTSWLLNLIESTKEKTLLNKLNLRKIEEEDQARARELILELEGEALNEQHPYFSFLDQRQQFAILLDALKKQETSKIEPLVKACAKFANGEGDKLVEALTPELTEICQKNPQVAGRLLNYLHPFLKTNEFHLLAIRSDQCKPPIASTLFIQAIDKDCASVAKELLSFMQKKALSQDLITAISKNFTQLLEGLSPIETVHFFKACSDCQVSSKMGGEKLLIGIKDWLKDTPCYEIILEALKAASKQALTNSTLIEEQIEIYTQLTDSPFCLERLLQLLPKASNKEKRVDQLITQFFPSKNIPLLFKLLSIYPEMAEGNWETVATIVAASGQKKQKEEFWRLLNSQETHPFSHYWMQIIESLIQQKSKELVSLIKNESLTEALLKYEDNPGFYFSLFDAMHTLKCGDELYFFYCRCSPILMKDEERHNALKAQLVPMLLSTKNPLVFQGVCEWLSSLPPNPKLTRECLQKGAAFEKIEEVITALQLLLSRVSYEDSLIEALLNYTCPKMHFAGFELFEEHIKTSSPLPAVKKSNSTIKRLFKQLIKNPDARFVASFLNVLQNHNCSHYLTNQDTALFLSSLFIYDFKLCLMQEKRQAFEEVFPLFIKFYPILALDTANIKLATTLAIRCLIRVAQFHYEDAEKGEDDGLSYGEKIERFGPVVVDFGDSFNKLLGLAKAPENCVCIFVEECLKAAEKEAPSKLLFLELCKEHILMVLKNHSTKRKELDSLINRYVFTPCSSIPNAFFQHMVASSTLVHQGVVHNVFSRTSLFELEVYLNLQIPPGYSMAEGVKLMNGLIDKVLEMQDEGMLKRILQVLERVQFPLYAPYPSKLASAYKKMISSFQKNHPFCIIEDEPIYDHFDKVLFKDGMLIIPSTEEKKDEASKAAWAIFSHYVEAILAVLRRQKEVTVVFTHGVSYDLLQYAVSLLQKDLYSEDEKGEAAYCGYVRELFAITKKSLDRGGDPKHHNTQIKKLLEKGPFPEQREALRKEWEALA